MTKIKETKKLVLTLMPSAIANPVNQDQDIIEAVMKKLKEVKN